MKRPAFQWYPGDHRRDTGLQACSFEARALWREMLDLMHDGDPRGHLTAGGVAITVDQLARLVGVPAPKAKRWIAELEERKVFGRTAAGVIYSRRMVKDSQLSQVRREAGRLGGNPSLLNQNDGKPPANPPAKPSATGQTRPAASDNQASEQGSEQTAEQNPTPAVAVAVAVPSLLEGSNSGAEITSPRATSPAAPLASAKIELPGDAELFLDAFYNRATLERYRDVNRQLVALLGPTGALHERQRVRTTPERLAAKCREVIADGVKDADKAIVVLLIKLADSAEVTEREVRAQREEQVREEVLTAEDEALAAAWLADHPAVNADIQREVDAICPPQAEPDPFCAMTRRVARRGLVVSRWRAAGSPQAVTA